MAKLANNPQERKRLFMGLLTLFSILLLLIMAYLLFAFSRPEAMILQYSFVIITVLLGLLTGLSLLALAITFFSLVRGSPPAAFSRLVEKTLVFLFPFIVQLGRLLRITQDSIQRSFIEVNNKLVESRRGKLTPKDILMLLPHCLQHDSCPHKVTRNAYNCKRCGKCPIHALLGLAEKWHVGIEVVTGGTLARQAVSSFRPRFIVAVACERDLSSGIMDCFPLPVWGVLNERPEGPCHNTIVSTAIVEEKLLRLLGGEKGGTHPGEENS